MRPTKQSIHHHTNSIQLAKFTNAPRRFAIPHTCANLRKSHSDSKLCVPTHHIPSASSFPDPAPLPTEALPAPYNAASAATFAQHLVKGINAASTCVLISAGHQLGLFATLHRLSPTPHSAHTIAREAGAISERYVREWLSAMTCAQIVEQSLHHDEQTRVYVLPAEHAHFLTWTERPCGNNLALLSQHIPILGRLENHLVDCFRSGRGLESHYFQHLESVCALDILQTIDGRFQQIATQVAGLHDLLLAGCSVLCIGGDAHRVYLDVAKQYPNSWFTCYDSSEHKVQEANARKARRGDARNLHFKAIQGGMYNIKETHSYDVALMFDSCRVRNSAHAQRGFAAIARALRPHMPLILLQAMMNGCAKEDRKHPMAALFYSLSTMYSLPASRLDDDCASDGRVVCGYAHARQMLLDNGFAEVHVHGLNGDELNCIMIAMSARD